MRVVVLTGTGTTFCAGFDLNEFAKPDLARTIRDSSRRYHLAVWRFAKPVIAAVNGAALGGGFDLSLLCDLRIATPDAEFAHPEIKFGAPPLFTPLQWIVGAGIARDLCLTGRRIDAAEGASPRSGERDRGRRPSRRGSHATARVIAEAPQPALEATKRYLTSSAGVTFDEAFTSNTTASSTSFCSARSAPAPTRRQAATACARPRRITRISKYLGARDTIMTTQISHFINGKRTAGQSKRTADVMDPNTGQVQAKAPMASSADVDEAVAGAVEAQKVWAAFNPQRRARVMMKFVDLVNQNIDELAELLSLEHGKTVADSKGDIQRGIEVIEFAVGIPHLIKGEYTEGAGTGIDVYSLRQPLGVVAGITPFNFPAMIPLWKAGPALACGNAFILKPSERDPSVPVRLAELFLEAGLPPGVFQVVHGDKEAVDAILEHPDIQAVGFVGSSDIAQYIYSTAAAHGKRAQCFGGAKNHMIVMPDADLDNAVDALIGAGYGSAGERCMAISVAVPVGQQTADRLRARLIERVNNLRVGHSLDPKADYGPLVTEAALARVKDYIDQGVEAGAEAVVDGRERTSDDLQFGDANLEGGYFIGPTLFDHVTPDMSIYTDEIFGPVLCIVRAENYEEALALPTEHEYGNGVAIFTRDGDTARDFVSRVQVGMVGVNVPIPVPVAYHTFGGWKRSGFGDLNQHGPSSIIFYTKVKTVTQRWPAGSHGAEFVIPTMK